MTILVQLADHARERVSEAKREVSLEEVRQRALSMQKGSCVFEKALKKDGISSSANAKKRRLQRG